MWKQSAANQDKSFCENSKKLQIIKTKDLGNIDYQHFWRGEYTFKAFYNHKITKTLEKLLNDY